MSDDETIARLRPWQRWLFFAFLLLLGGAMLAIGLWEAAGLVTDLRALPPVVTVTTDMAAFLPLGIACLGFSTIALFPRAQPEPVGRSRRGAKPDGKRLDHAQRVVALGLVCLLLYPVLTVGCGS